MLSQFGKLSMIYDILMLLIKLIIKVNGNAINKILS